MNEGKFNELAILIINILDQSASKKKSQAFHKDARLFNEYDTTSNDIDLI